MAGGEWAGHSARRFQSRVPQDIRGVRPAARHESHTDAIQVLPSQESGADHIFDIRK